MAQYRRRIVVVLLLSVLVVPARTTSGNQKPNILLFLADDLGKGDLSAYNEEAVDISGRPLTPTLDALISRGVSFTDFHSAPLCAPSRYSLLSGRNEAHSSVNGAAWGFNGRSSFPNGQLTLPKVLRENNYRTAHFGKWHMGGRLPNNTTRPRTKCNPNTFITDPLNCDFKERSVTLAANYVGFDVSYYTVAGIDIHGPYMYFENDRLDVENFSIPEDFVLWEAGRYNNSNGFSEIRRSSGRGLPSWATNAYGIRMVERARAFLDEHLASYSTRPFFMYFASEAVHIPHTPPDDFFGAPVRGSTRSYHLDMVRNVDLQVKMLLEALDTRGIRNETLVIFLSDNGGLPHTPGHDTSLGRRGTKASPYEGGHRVPAIIDWSGQTEQGKVVNRLVSITDIFRTLTDIVGIDVPPHQAADSISFVDAVLQPSTSDHPIALRDEFYTKVNVTFRYTRWTRFELLRRGRLKLIRWIDNDDEESAYELYDLENDPTESDEIFNAFQDRHRVLEMRSALEKYHH
eukprot:g2206.t1